MSAVVAAAAADGVVDFVVVVGARYDEESVMRVQTSAQLLPARIPTIQKPSCYFYLCYFRTKSCV